MKKILSVALCAAMILSMASVSYASDVNPTLSNAAQTTTAVSYTHLQLIQNVLIRVIDWCHPNQYINIFWYFLGSRAHRNHFEVIVFQKLYKSVRILLAVSGQYSCLYLCFGSNIHNSRGHCLFRFGRSNIISIIGTDVYKRQPYAPVLD